MLVEIDGYKTINLSNGSMNNCSIDFNQAYAFGSAISGKK